MPTVKFIGRVLPERLKLTIHNHHQLVFKDESFPEIVMDISIQEGVITVVCGVNGVATANEHAAIFLRARTIARTTVDLAAFSLARPFFVIFDTMETHTGQIGDLDEVHGSLAKECTAYALSDPDTFDQAFRIMHGNSHQTFALRDLVTSIGQGAQSVVSCARAVETIRNLIAPGQERKVAWPIFRETLNVDEAYVKFVTDNARALRHGNFPEAPKEGHAEISRRAWAIMNRYLEYKKRGDKELPLAEFPLLTG